MALSLKLLAFLLLLQNSATQLQFTNEIPKYSPTWDSLDNRPLPQWFDKAKIGIFLHWGVFSVPGFEGEWFWNYWKGGNKKIVDFMKKNYKPGFAYQDFASEFTAEFFNPDEWAELFKKSGAKYVVLTSKHHDGFALWPSQYSFGWNSMDLGPHRDLLGELSQSVREQGLISGLYHSLYEWFNPLYLSDKSSNFTKKAFVKNKMLPEMYELVNKYKPSVIWSDGDWEAYDSYFSSTEFLAWLYNSSPVKNKVVVNDRWGIGIPCKHGDFYSCKDRYNPGTLQEHKWENAMTLDKESWGFRRNMNLTDVLTTKELIQTLAETISCGGNILINIGPTKDGIISPIFQERLLELGKWLRINGEAIYDSKPWKTQNDTVTKNVWYTSKGLNLYAIVLNWPENVLKLGLNWQPHQIILLGNQGELQWHLSQGRLYIQFPDKATVKSEWGWVIKIINV